MKIKHLIIGLIIIAVIAVIAHTAKANGLFFPVTTSSAAATTTVSYISAGFGTTTLAVDTYSSGIPTAAVKGTLLIQFGASSTASILRVNQEYAQQSSTGSSCVTAPLTCDWYQDGGTYVDNYATSTKPYDASQVSQFNINFASSTAGLGSVLSSVSTTTRAISVRTPTRYTRFIFTVPTSAAAGNVWAQFVPIKEVQSNN